MSDVVIYDAMRISSSVGMGISAFAASGMTLAYMIFIRGSQKDNTNSRLVFSLALSDVFFSLAQLVQINVVSSTPPSVCVAAMFFFILFYLSSCFAVTCLATSMALTFLTKHLKSVTRTQSQNRSKYFQSFVWGASLIIALLPFTQNMYAWSELDETCWFADSGTTHNIIWQFAVLFGPLAFCIVFCTIVFFLVSREILKSKAIIPPSAVRSAKSMQFYPLVFIFINFWNFLVEIQSFVTSDTNVVLLFLNVITLALQGVMDATVFFYFNSSINEAFLRLIRALGSGRLPSKSEYVIHHDNDSSDSHIHEGALMELEGVP